MKTVRFLLLAAVLLCGNFAAQAQIRQGEWYSSYALGGGMSTFAGDVKDVKTRWALAFNAEVGYNLTDWFAPSAGITNTYQSVGFLDADKDLWLDVLSVPVLMNFSAGPFTLKAGIQPDFILSARMNSTNYASELKTFSLSAPLALNWNCYTDDDGDLWFLELRYHLGLTKMNKDDQIRNAWFSNGSIRNSVLLLTIGYKCDL